MSTTSRESSPSPPESPPKVHTSPQTHLPDDQPADAGCTMSDIFLWKRKNISISVVLGAMATWLLLEVYQFNFITIACWLSIFVVSVLFISANIFRLLAKEFPDLSGIEISEKWAREAAMAFRQSIEKFVGWVIHLGAEREWFVPVGAAVCLFLLSLVASQVDLLTLGFLGVMVGMSVPVACVKYENKIREYGERSRAVLQRVNVAAQDKWQKLKSKVAGQRKDIKVKKTE